jgi:hypothetical protein
MLANGRSPMSAVGVPAPDSEHAPLGGVAGQKVRAHALLTAKHSYANPTDKKLVDQYLVNGHRTARGNPRHPGRSAVDRAERRG